MTKDALVRLAAHWQSHYIAAHFARDNRSMTVAGLAHQMTYAAYMGHFVGGIAEAKAE